jgi:tRNA threonylcarbamoyladenosine biosynthesis protein TsaE
MKLEVNSTSSENTQNIAATLARNLKGGEVIDLLSDVGGGKTVFVRGLAKGIKSPDVVQSPTFTISRIYQGSGKYKSIAIHHFDFYRLDDPGVMSQALAEAVADSQAVIAVEWSDIVKDILPAGRLSITIRPTGESGRQLIFTAGKSHQHLLKGLK